MTKMYFLITDFSITLE